MGYWIIVILIVLGGILVLIAAFSVDANDADEKLSVRAKPVGRQVVNRSPRSPKPDHRLSLVMFLPQSWLQGAESFPDLGIRGVASRIQPVRSSLLSDIAAAADLETTGLADSITVIVVGADDFLAGHSLDAVLNDLDRLLDHLANQPAMAVIGSVPDLGPAIAETLSDVSAESISATVALWNVAIADLSESYSAEFVDLGLVPVNLVKLERNYSELSLSAAPDLAILAATLTPACSRAADRVRSVRTET